MFQLWPKPSSQKIGQFVICPKKKVLAEARLTDSTITKSLENVRVSVMEDARAMETTLSPRKNARGNARKLKLKVMIIYMQGF